MNWYQSRIRLREAPHRGFATVRRAVVHDPEHAPRGVVRWLAHDLIDQALKGRDTGSRFAAAEHFGAMHVQCGQVRPCAATHVLVLHAHGLACCGGQARMDAQTRLDAGLLVCGDDKFIRAQRLPLPAPLVQVQDASGLGLELRVARKDPAAVLPGTDRVLVQPAPHGAVADARHQPRALGVSRHICHTEPRQRQSQGGRQFARQRLDFNRELWGEKPEGVPGGPSLRGPPFALRRIACATG